jgi:hypothetical protein
MIGPTFVFAAIGFALMYVIRRYWDSALISPRALPWVAAPTAFFVAFGVPPLLYAAGGMAYSDNGMTVLLILDTVTLCVAVFEGFLAHRFHKVTTTFLCGLFGFCVAVTWADWPQVTHFITHLPGQASKSMGKESRHIAATHGHATHQQYVYAVVIAIAVGVVVLAARSRHNSNVRVEGLDPQAIPQPVMDRSLGVGTFFGNLWSAGRKTRPGFQRVPGALPLDAPRPPSGGRRNELPASPGAPVGRG